MPPFVETVVLLGGLSMGKGTLKTPIHSLDVSPGRQAACAAEPGRHQRTAPPNMTWSVLRPMERLVSSIFVGGRCCCGGDRGGLGRFKLQESSIPSDQMIVNRTITTWDRNMLSGKFPNY